MRCGQLSTTEHNRACDGSARTTTALLQRDATDGKLHSARRHHARGACNHKRRRQKIRWAVERSDKCRNKPKSVRCAKAKDRFKSLRMAKDAKHAVMSSCMRRRACTRSPRIRRGRFPAQTGSHRAIHLECEMKIGLAAQLIP